MLLVRVSRQNIPATLAHIDRTWDAFAPSIPIKRRFTDELFEQNYEIFEIFNQVFAGLALFAVLVACIGLFGSATYATGRRVREIGVRKTLGASSNRIVRMLLWDFSKPVLVANAIAWPIGFVVMQIYFSMFVFRADPTGAPFIMSLLLTLLVAWVAVAAQSYDASRVQPARVLRSE
jgi:putative ABC transport system permease protein